MTTNILKFAAMAVFAAIIAAGCGSGKQATSSTTTNDIDQQIALKKKQMELDQVNAEVEIQKKRNEMAMQEVENEAAQKTQNTRKMLAGEQRTTIFCMEEAFDKPGEYMGGLGVVEDRPDRTRAILDANRAAIADISTRYIGMIKNAIEDYSKDVNVPSGKKMYESSLEGGAAAIGTKVIDKYANAVCREVSQSATGD
ncbi:MAG: hypothetical protein LBL90_13470 [Prevotellaceae bacterium]|jgi:hypothetical protein|nr:hypothetical protein [Prevotellaceae bacterium]